MLFILKTQENVRRMIIPQDAAKNKTDSKITKKYKNKYKKITCYK